MAELNVNQNYKYEVFTNKNELRKIKNLPDKIFTPERRETHIQTEVMQIELQQGFSHFEKEVNYHGLEVRGFS